jgi:methylated-DNA-protein-cysteine methyltransferase-like protein
MMIKPQEAAVKMKNAMEAKFNERVWNLVRQIPAGKVTSYGRVAQMLGVPRAAREVGWAMSAIGSTSAAKDVPWQRVVNSEGRISTIAFIAEQQRARLQAEGVQFDPADDLKILNFKGILWEPSEIEIQHILLSNGRAEDETE